MPLLSLLLGKKVKFQNQTLGQFESQRIRGNHPNKSYNWYCNKALYGSEEKTMIVLKGNNKQPYDSHLKTIISILDNWQSVYEPLVDKQIAKLNPKLKDYYVNWQSELHIGMILPLDDNKPVQILK